MSIGNQIAELIYRKRVTQKQLAEDLNISPSTINNYIRDCREPDIETLKILASYFCVTIDYLLEYQVSTNDLTGKTVNKNEQELLNTYRCLNKEQQELLIEQGKLYINANSKKTSPPSTTTLRTGTEKNK